MEACTVNCGNACKLDTVQCKFNNLFICWKDEFSHYYAISANLILKLSKKIIFIRQWMNKLLKYLKYFGAIDCKFTVDLTTSFGLSYKTFASFTASFAYIKDPKLLINICTDLVYCISQYSVR
jgi:hypothetical protein